MTDSELIEICRKQIEEKLHLPGNGSWKQRDFQYLADLIVERTGTRISLSTLKRIWNEKDNHLPQLYTLNALVQLLDFNSWNEYKKVQVPAFAEQETKQPAVKKRKEKLNVLLAIIPIAAIGLFAYFCFSGDKNINPADIVFKSKKNVNAGVPNTVVFEYDISKTNADSAIIQQSWDERMRATVSRNNHFQTFIYYYPGYHTARLIMNNKVIKTEKVNISTNGWEVLVDGDVADRTPFYIPKKDIFSNKLLHVSRNTLIQNNIPANDKEFNVNFFKVGDIGNASSENFSFETMIKNSLEDGALVCQYSQLNLICENGMISIPFCNPGCASKIHLHVSDVFKKGENNDLSSFGIDLSSFRRITIQSIKKDMSILVDGKKIYQLKYTKDLGTITGFHYYFFGCGSVAQLTLKNDRNEVVYKDDFLMLPQ